MRKLASFYFFRRKPIVQKDSYESWRGVANLLNLKAHERLRVEWMVFYYTAGKENATLTAQHFGISRKTFHKWLRRFQDSKYNVRSLHDQSKTPHHKRKWEVTLIKEDRIRSSGSAADFLYRLRYVVNQPIENLLTDNGSEFAWEFERAAGSLGIQRYFSRVKTPKG